MDTICENCAEAEGIEAVDGDTSHCTICDEHVGEPCDCRDYYAESLWRE